MFTDLMTECLSEDHTGGEMAAVTGKRYKCTDCDAEFIVTRGSDEGELRCGDSPLEQL
jgi:hypothetical protein